MDAKSIQFLSFFFLLLSTASPAFTPQDNYLVNCGSSSAAVPVDRNRRFVGDSSANGSLYLTRGRKSSLSLSDPNPKNLPSIYTTARLFTAPSTYTFRIKKRGTHLLRFHFSPFASRNHDLRTAKFSVSANRVPLLSRFAPNSTALKEFFLTVDSPDLEITFDPAANFAYASAIEVISAPENYFVDAGGIALITPDGIQEFEQNTTEQVLETVHRINVGGPTITPFNDTLWRTWIPDEAFLVLKSAARAAAASAPPNYQPGGATRESAPDRVYMTAQQMNVVNRSLIFTFNITWDFPVDAAGDTHFVRLHFCDIVSVALNTLYFNVYINEVAAYRDLDLSMLAFRRLASPYYIDFAVKNSKESKVVRISVGPSLDLGTTLRKNAILNGVEIMKMVNFAVTKPSSKRSYSKWGVVGSILGGSFALILTCLAVFALLKFGSRKSRPKPTRSKSVSLRAFRESNSSEGTSKIPFSDIKSATNNFDESLIIGSGGFGTVYKGVLGDDNKKKVAVKRGMPGCRQGLPEFHTEITVLSKIRHHHLVSLVGYCEEESEMILVYEYMEKGPLRRHLYGGVGPPLSWKQRLEVCIGAARGLHYLHTGSAQGVIHRDIKSTNILLDENFVAKVADFGLSKSGPCLDETHVSTGVKGSFGYLDPEYFRRRQLTDKSDIYSFGVVLFEVLCARPAIDPLLNREEMNLGEWAMEWQRRGTIERIVDSRIIGEIKSNVLKVFGETAEKCLADYGVDRPSMGDVLWNLEYAYQLQTNGEQAEDRRVRDDGPEASVALREGPMATGRANDDNDKDDVSSELSTSRVFSQLITSEGR